MLDSTGSHRVIADLDRLEADNNDLIDRLAVLRSKLSHGYEGRHELSPKQRRATFKVLKGGLSALVGPFVLLVHQARDHAMAATATVAAVAVPVAITTSAVIAEAPSPAGIEQPQQHATLDVGTPHPPVPDLVSPPRRVAEAGTPSSTPSPGVSPIPEPVAEVMPLPLITVAPTVAPPADPTVTPTPTPIPTPTPLPSSVVWTQASATAWCLEQLEIPPIGLHDCVDELTD